MSERAEKLKPVLAELSADERAELMDYLAGLDDGGDGEELSPEEWEAHWVEEIDRRVADLRAGKTKLIPAEEVMRKLREKFG